MSKGKGIPSQRDPRVVRTKWSHRLCILRFFVESSFYCIPNLSITKTLLFSISDLLLLVCFRSAQIPIHTHDKYLKHPVTASQSKDGEADNDCPCNRWASVS
ncbi:hypothetical protein L1987_47801 [Smallanthus sonchifolius]|uniref:Uncharacterized protein n=1 Tax=Smallanthus sonchifolius TaxID=185202 RepID=A0ACB9FRB1_9ASTR|nr:hypothetical protein L1987_47801 [Smallanthus sonchifolius]